MAERLARATRDSHAWPGRRGQAAPAQHGGCVRPTQAGGGRPCARPPRVQCREGFVGALARPVGGITIQPLKLIIKFLRRLVATLDKQRAGPGQAVLILQTT